MLTDGVDSDMERFGRCLHAWVLYTSDGNRAAGNHRLPDVVQRAFLHVRPDHPRIDSMGSGCGGHARVLDVTDNDRDGFSARHPGITRQQQLYLGCGFLKVMRHLADVVDEGINVNGISKLADLSCCTAQSGGGGALPFYCFSAIGVTDFCARRIVHMVNLSTNRMANWVRFGKIYQKLGAFF
jgi:hypothetical protein